jgi:hypothetical protein
MGPGESKSEENICGSDSNSVFLGIPENPAVPFNELVKAVNYRPGLAQRVPGI